MDEEKLVAAFRDQDPAAVRELLSSHGDRLLRSAFLLCGREADAQDLVQETFLQALQSAPRFRNQSSLYTWLHGILLNLTRHYHRDRKRIVYGDEQVERAAAAAEESPIAMDLQMTGSALQQALGRLSLPHREVVILRFYEDMKIHEIAAHLGISRGTVKSRLHYSIERLQQLVSEEMNLFAAEGTQRAERT
ncbi:MAG: RNA polymerase sigma factor [Verrucomicrobiota bacterium]|jgi:RNA polymerase sigma-70 factor (ECF subfamily)